MRYHLFFVSNLCLSTIALFLGAFPALSEASEPGYESAPILYSDTNPDTKLTRLFSTIGKNSGILTAENNKDLVAEFLDLMDVPRESQVLVFSKTSAQNSRISPQTPRSIYFSENAYIGWVQGGEFEVTSFDPKLGMVFHLVNITDRKKSEPPTITRDRSCLNCHAGSSNRNYPGLMVRSVFPDERGQPVYHAGTYHTRQDSPIEERWGGWFVTGEVTNHSHMGNSIAYENEKAEREVDLLPLSPAPVNSLKGFVNTSPYLGGDSSDILALMLLEHQVGVHNILVRANLTTQQTLHRHKEMRRAFGEPEETPLSETNQKIIKNLAEDILEEMLFVNEVPLADESIESSLEYQKAFESNRIKDSEGRSLKDLRLYERLFKYRCSYMIYSEAFTHLPKVLKDNVLEMLHGILTDAPSYPEFSHLGSQERKRIHSILSETLPKLPDFW